MNNMMSSATLPNDFFLKRHNVELYVEYILHEYLPFLDMFPVVNNEYGEFSSAVWDKSVGKLMEDGEMEVPETISEDVDFTELDFRDVKEKRGSLIPKGFSFRWSNRLIRQGKLSANLGIKYSDSLSNLSHFYNGIFCDDLSNASALRYGSSKDTDTFFNLKDPRKSSIDIQTFVNDDGHSMKVTNYYMNNFDYAQLLSYVVSFDSEHPFHNIDIRAKSVTFDGVTFYNVDNAIQQGTFLALDNLVPAAVLEKYVDPQFSTLQAKIIELESNNTMSQSKKEERLKTIPQPLVNVHKLDTLEYNPTSNRAFIWAEMGLNVREPHMVMTGLVKSGDE